MQTWHLSVCWLEYLLYCLVVTLVVRLVVCFYKALQYKPSRMSVWYRLSPTPPGHRPSWLLRWNRRIETFIRGFQWFGRVLWDFFLGWRRPLPGREPDYLTNSLIGLFEAAAYPVLIHVNALEPIGLWLAMKTAGNWSQWGKSRTSFSRYLVGNLIVLAFSYGASSWFITT